MLIAPKLAADICDVKMATIRQWVHRGHLTRYDHGIDVHELIDWLERRDPRALASRAGLRGPVRRATETRNSRAARLLREAVTEHRRMLRVTPNATPDTPDFGGWLRPRRD